MLCNVKSYISGITKVNTTQSWSFTTMASNVVQIVCSLCLLHINIYLCVSLFHSDVNVSLSLHSSSDSKLKCGCLHVIQPKWD